MLAPCWFFSWPWYPSGALLSSPQTIDPDPGDRQPPHPQGDHSRAHVHSPGDTYDPVSIERDFNSLWNTGYFEDLRIEREDTEKGIILNVFVRERPTIREINYKGMSSVSQSDMLDRFKKEKVGLSVEGQYDPTKVKRAETVLAELLAEHGHQFATIKAESRRSPRPRCRSTSASRKVRRSKSARSSSRQRAHQQPVSCGAP